MKPESGRKKKLNGNFENLVEAEQELAQKCKIPGVIVLRKPQKVKNE